MQISYLLRVVALLAAISCSHRSSLPEIPTRDGSPEEVTVCQLQTDPAKYNHKLIKITGFISHGFEDFAIFDPECESRQGIWLEYGGTKASNTMYCCGVVPGHSRPENITVENIQVPLVDDDQFKKLELILKKRYDTVMHATIVGRFFSGEKVKYPGGEHWSGYGHAGCCMLLVIQQVMSVDSQNRARLDYGSSADQPNLEGEGCGYRILSSDWRFTHAIDLQRKAESGERSWAFDSPLKVATDALSRHTGIAESSIARLKQVRQSEGRIVYEWRPKRSEFTFMVVVARPYALSFYAKNPERVSWVPIAAYKIGCGA